MELSEAYAGQYTDEDAARSATASSFAELYVRSREDVYRAVLLTVRDPGRAEDAVQEAFARAYADWDRISVHPNPVGWVARVALNHATSLWRRLRRESSEPPPALVAPDDERPMDPLLIRAMWRLPRRQRQVVALRILLDQSIEQTAQSLGMAPGTVRAHLHRALRRLREQLERAGHDMEGFTS
ncbi:MAG: SigE family RNA polymerase sigma factor [Chloroflexota bacterium]|nr:SigE family RNA polymerase sigma factor [Chloroflexota bacterium]